MRLDNFWFIALFLASLSGLLNRSPPNFLSNLSRTIMLEVSWDAYWMMLHGTMRNFHTSAYRVITALSVLLIHRMRSKLQNDLLQWWVGNSTCTSAIEVDIIVLLDTEAWTENLMFVPLFSRTFPSYWHSKTVGWTLCNWSSAASTCDVILPTQGPPRLSRLAAILSHMMTPRTSKMFAAQQFCDHDWEPDWLKNNFIRLLLNNAVSAFPISALWPPNSSSLLDSTWSRLGTYGKADQSTNSATTSGFPGLFMIVYGKSKDKSQWIAKSAERLYS